MSFRLRDLSYSARLGISFSVIALVIGFVASIAHLGIHHEEADKKPGISANDITTAYHGIQEVSPLRVALERGHPEGIPDEERELLLDWLNGDREKILEDYDNIDLGFAAPSELISINCGSCHFQNSEDGGGIHETVPLDYLDDIKLIAFSDEIPPTSRDILIVSTHTHALSLGVITIALSLLLLATRWPTFLSNLLVFVGGFALLADLVGWWVARSIEGFVLIIIASGAAYTGSMVLASILVVLDLWLPAEKDDAS